MTNITVAGFPLDREGDDLSTVRSLLDGPTLYMCSRVIAIGQDVTPKAIILTGNKQLVIDWCGMFEEGDDPNKQVWLSTLKSLCYTYQAYAIIKLIHGYIKKVPNIKDYDPDKPVKDQGGVEAIIADIEIAGDKHFSSKAVIEGKQVEPFSEFISITTQGGRMDMKLLPKIKDPLTQA